MAYIPPHQGDFKNSVRVASTSNITLSAPGSSIDGVTMVAGNRFLAKDQSTASQNGIYIWIGSASTAIRATDADTSGEITSGMLVHVEEGSVNKDKEYILKTDDPITIGSTSLSFIEYYPIDSVSTCIWRQGALVTVTGTTSLIFADNGAVATYNSSAGYRGITRLNPDHYTSGGRILQVRAVLNYATVTSPSAKIGCSLFPVTAVSSGTLTLGSVLTTSETVSSAGANEAGAVETPWVTISSPTFLAATFEWKTTSGASNTYGDMRIEVRQQ